MISPFIWSDHVFTNHLRKALYDSFFPHRVNLEKISFSPKSWMFMESDHGGKTSLTNSSSFAPRTLSSFLWTFINNTITSTLSLFDPLCYNHSNHPIQSPKYLICLLYKLSLLTKKLLWELNILGNLDARSYHLRHIKTSLCWNSMFLFVVLV